ncbi:hypothetical protein [Planotetraspora mira]|uniref:Uncharacterized protein n=1 Tax=Planotetraspora mira TaxID=58121 RepID=A0A8J3TVB2_9ACTN|nr:hypothetical protein [Planotetraspora mira]GII32867.1 hypothetical protein Pmi06nite_63090 [Planotetraspora mira]
MLVTSCSETGVASPSVPPTPSGPPVDVGSYSSPQDIVAKLQSVGITCPDYEPIANATGARDRGTCKDGNLVVPIYDREGDVQTQIEMEMGFADIVGISLLTGRNWTVNYDNRPTLEKAKSVLGGTLVVQHPAS